MVLRAVCLAALSLSPTLAAASTPDPGDTAALIALEHQWLTALQHRDTAALDRILDPAFVDTPPSGPLRSKADCLRRSAVPSSTSQTLGNLQVHPHGDTAIVTGTNLIVGPGNSYTVTIRFTDIFQRRQGQWRALAAQEAILPAPSR